MAEGLVQKTIELFGKGKSKNFPKIENPLVAQEEANTILGVDNKTARVEGYSIDKDAVKKLDERAHDYVLTAQAEKTVDAEEKAYKDALTGAVSRGALDEILVNMLQHRRSNSADLLVLMDLDDFKEVNDRYGRHSVGDSALRQLVSITEKHIRGQDVVGRYGGDEFVVILPGAIDYEPGWEQRSLDRVENLRLTVERELSNRVSRDTGITVNKPITSSMGVIAVGPSGHYDLSSIYADLDEQLYRAKKMGRNRIASPLQDYVHPL